MNFVDPKNDLAFKKIFGDENHTTILISLLNSILGFEGVDKIVSVNIANPYQVPRIKDLKESILDVNAENQRGEKFIVEMQGKDESNFKKRSVYYTSKAYVKQLKSGEGYDTLQKVYFIAFVNFNMFDSEDYLSRHMILNLETMNQDLNSFEFAFIELQKFNKELCELETILDKWVFFIKNASNLTMIPKELNSIDELKEAFQIANQGMWSQDELDIYEHMIFEEHAERYRMENEFSKGMKQGIQKMSSEVAKEKTERLKAEEREAEAKEREEQAKEREAEAKEREEQAKEREEQAKEREAEAKEREEQAKADKQKAEEREIQIVEALAKSMNISIEEAKKMFLS